MSQDPPEPPHVYHEDDLWWDVSKAYKPEPVLSVTTTTSLPVTSTSAINPDTVDVDRWGSIPSPYIADLQSGERRLIHDTPQYRLMYMDEGCLKHPRIGCSLCVDWPRGWNKMVSFPVWE
jgi:hypothetical protein